MLLLAWLLAANLVGFAAAGLDKPAAGRKDARMPELVFHALALLGGWLGTGLAFLLFHHKTRTDPFRWVFGACSLANAAVVAWWVALRPG